MRENLLKKQPTWGLRRAQGSGQKSTTPATLTKVILVLLTMFLLPSAAWSVEVTKTITFNKEVGETTIAESQGLEGVNTSLPVSITENNSTYDGVITINSSNTISSYSCSEGGGAVFKMIGYNASNSEFLIIVPGNYPAVPSQVTVKVAYANAPSNQPYFGIGLDQSIDTSNTNDYKYTSGALAETTVTFTADGAQRTNRESEGTLDLWFTASSNINNDPQTTTVTIKEITVTYETNNYGLTVAGIPVTSANAADILGDQSSSVSFTPGEGSNSGTLTLKNATITGNIIKQSSADDKTLIVNLDGINTLDGTFFFNDQNPGDLTFTGTGSLTITSESIFDTSVNSVNTANGLYLSTNDPNLYKASRATISSTEAYPIWVYNASTEKYTQLTATASTYTTQVTGNDDYKGSVSYSANNNTLTLDNFLCKTTDQNVFVFHIGSSLTNLTVDLVGTNEIFYNSFNYFKPTGGGNLQLTYTTSSNGSLKFEGGVTYNYVDYAYENGLGFYSSTISTDWPRLQVGNTLVRGTMSSVGDDSKISYDDVTNTLTLGGTTIGTQGSLATTILVYIKDLKVAISGNNILYGQFYGQYVEDGFKAGTISFLNTDHVNASLTIIVNELGPVENFAQCTLGDGLKITEAKDGGEVVSVDGISYVEGNFMKGNDIPDYLKIAYQSPQLTVAGIEPDADGKFEGLTGVIYTPPTMSLDSQIPDTPATLTLDNATIAGDIRSTLTSLTIHLIGENTLTPGDGVAPFLFTEGSGSGSLTFESTEKEEGNLLVTNGNTYYKRTLSNLVRQDDVTDPVYVVSNTFDEYGNTGDWQLAFDTPSENDLQIYRNVKYNLWVTYDGIDYQYTKANRSSIVYGPNYDPENKALEFSGDYTNPIKSSMDELNLKILKINNYGSLPQITFIPIVDVQETGALNIIAESSEETAEMVFESTTNTEPVISGFTTVNYDGFTILSDGAKYDTDKKKLVDAEGQTMTLAVFTTSVELAKPIFETPSEDGMVSLVNDNLYTIGSGTDSQEIYYGTIKYSIVYADGSEGVTDEMFTEAFTISKPATVTAKVTLNGESSDNAIGKYFGAKDVFTVAIGDKIEGTSWFTPAIESGDQIESKFMLQGNDESGIFEMGGEGPDHYLVAKKSGETTVIAYLFSSSNSSSSSTGTTVLNVSGEPILITFTVGESLSSVFEGNNNYGGFYNDSDTPYAKPEGTSVYLITGISEDGTSVTTQSIDYLPAHTAVLLQKGTGAKAITKIPYEGSATVPTNNKFYYSNPNSPATAPTTRSWYVIYNNQFVKVTGGTQVKGGKCYLDLGTTAGTRGFYNIGDGEGTTAIHKVISEGVNSEKLADGEWYTLQGQRVAKPAKGLYILNGKKVVVK